MLRARGDSDREREDRARLKARDDRIRAKDERAHAEYAAHKARIEVEQAQAQTQTQTPIPSTKAPRTERQSSRAAREERKGPEYESDSARRRQQLQHLAPVGGNVRHSFTFCACGACYNLFLCRRLRPRLIISVRDIRTLQPFRHST